MDENDDFKPVSVLLGNRAPVYNVAVAPDGQQVLTSDTDGQIIGFNISNPVNIFSEYIITLPKGYYRIRCLDKRQILIGGLHEVSVRDTKRSQSKQLLKRDVQLLSMDFSVARNEIATGWDDGKIFITCLDDKSSQPISGHKEGVFALTYSAGGGLLVSGGGDGSVYLRESHDWNAVQQIQSHPKPITAVAVAPDSNVIASACRAGRVRFWHLTKSDNDFGFAFRPRVIALTFSSNCWQLACGFLDHSLIVLNILEPDPHSDDNMVVKGCYNPIYAMAFTPSGWLFSSHNIPIAGLNIVADSELINDQFRENILPNAAWLCP